MPSASSTNHYSSLSTGAPGGLFLSPCGASQVSPISEPEGQVRMSIAPQSPPRLSALPRLRNRDTFKLDAMKFLISCASSFCAVILAAYTPTILADEPAKNAVIFGNTTLDEVSLIGLPKDEALRRLGAPEEIAGPEEGYQTYDYPK